MADLAVMMGGYATEKMIFKDFTTGASNDLEKASQLARALVTRYGMSDKLGTLTLGRHNHQIFLGRDMMEQKDYSEETAKAIDEEIRTFVDDSYNRARKLLLDNREKLDRLAKKLMEKEVLDIEEVKVFLGISDLPKNGQNHIPAERS